MLPELCTAFGLLAVCVVIHSTGVTWIAQKLVLPAAGRLCGSRAAAWLLIRVAWALVLLHLSQILLWAAFYCWEDCLPDFRTAAYFSGVSYTTIGYGDVVLPKGWWFLGPVEGLTGILMCGLSTGFFFIVVSRLFTVKQPPAAEKPFRPDTNTSSSP